MGLGLVQRHGEAVDAGLGEAVSLLEAHAALTVGALHRFRAGRAAGDGPTHAAQVGRDEGRVVGHHLVHGRDQEQHGGAGLARQPQVVAGVEGALERDARAEVEQRHGEGVVGGVEAGGGLHHAVVIAQTPRHDGVDSVVEALPVGLHGALGQPGGAAREQDHLDVLGVERRRLGRGRRRRQQRLVVVERYRGDAEGGGHVEVLGIGEHQAGPHIGGDGARLGRRQAVVEGGVDGAGLGGGEQQVEVGDVVERQDRHPVALADAAACQQAGQPLGAAVHLGVVVPAPLPVDGRARRGELGAAAGDVEDHGSVSGGGALAADRKGLGAHAAQTVAGERAAGEVVPQRRQMAFHT